MANIWRSITSTVSRSSKRFALLAVVAPWLCLLARGSATACPFCTALEPTLSQLRAQAGVVVLAEAQHPADGGRATLKVHQVLSGESRWRAGESIELVIDRKARPGSLLLLFGNPPSSRATDAPWRAVVVDETSYAYFVQAPAARLPVVDRLRYFARHLEHRNPLIAQDAYLEFGHAALADVRQVVGLLPSERLRGWLADQAVPPARKGFFGLALGLATDEQARRANARFLQELIVEPQDDFRAGFDGILGGYLLLAGESGLELIESRYLANPRAADGDVRHALVALRFYHEYGKDIPAVRLQTAVRRLLARPEFAAAAITDLARWQAWQAPESIAALYEKTDYSTPSTRLAIVGYLLACPLPQARTALRALRDSDPQGVAGAEQVLSLTGSLSPATQ
jgi:hypothetical protein